MSTPMMQILQGEDLEDQAPVAPPTSARATVAAVPTLGVIGGPAAPPAAPPEATADPQVAPAAAAAATPAPGRAVAQQGAQVAQPPPKFKLPPVDEMVANYQRWTMMAADPDVAREVAPRLQAWRNLTLQQHAQNFDGDPMASPEQAAAYARHMGKVQGQLGQPLPWEQAAKIAEYTEGRKAQMPQQFLAGMNRYDKAAVQPFIDDVFGDGWTLQSLAPSKANIGGTEMEVPSITVVGPNGETRTHTSVEAAAMFGNYEGAYKLADLNRKRELEAAQADLDLARANQDPAAAAAAFDKLTTLKGGMGSIGPGKAAGAGAMAHMPTINAAIQETQSPLDPLFVLSILHNESAGDPKARSPVGASGVMQFMPGTAKDYGVADPTNPDQAIRGGVRYLNFLYKKFGGDLQKVAAGYNAGEGRVDQYGGVPPFKETQQYVKNVLGTYQKHKGQPGADPNAAGRRLIGTPLGAAPGAPGGGYGYTPALIAKREQAENNYAKEKAAIRRAGLGEKEETRLLTALEADHQERMARFGVGPAAAPAAAPPGMPTQPPGAAGKPPAAAKAPDKPAATGKLDTPEKVAAWLDERV